MWLLWKVHLHRQEQAITSRVPKVLGVVSRELFEGRETYRALRRPALGFSMCFVQSSWTRELYQAESTVVRKLDLCIINVESKTCRSNYQQNGNIFVSCTASHWTHSLEPII